MSNVLETPVSISIATDEDISGYTAEYYLRTALVVAHRYQRLSKHTKFRDIVISKNFDRVTMTATAGLSDHGCRLMDQEGVAAVIPEPLVGPIIINGVAWVPRFPDYENGVLVYSVEEEETQP